MSREREDEDPGMTVAELQAEYNKRRGKPQRQPTTSGPQLPSFLNKKKKISEAKMTASQKRKEEKLKKKYDDSSMKQNMIDQYGEKKGTQIYFATIRGKAMEETNHDEAYDYIIEALVEADFAQDYESAENMFEAMSSDFVSSILEEYIEEKIINEGKLPKLQKREKNIGRKGYDTKGKPIERVSKTHVIHDVDDNVADQRDPNAAKIDVMRKVSESWKSVKKLTPSEFAHHNLKPGDEYGFNSFRDTDLFKKTTKSNKNVTRIGDSRKRPARKSVITARGGSPFGSKKPSTPMDKPGEFAKDLKTRIGIKGLERKNVHFTGGMRGGSGPEKKAKIAKKIVTPDSKKVIATDDHLQNVRHMAAAAHDENRPTSGPKIRAFQSRPAKNSKGKVKEGDIVPVRVGKEKNLSDPNIGIRSKTNPSKSTQETQRRRKKAKRGMKNEEMSAYEYWKQFID